MSIFAAHAIVYGPATWAAAERHKAEQIDQENRMFCQKLQMAPGTERFAICAGYLAEVRRLHAERLAAEAAGLL